MLVKSLAVLSLLMSLLLAELAVAAGPVTTSQTDYAFAVFPTNATSMNDVESAWAVKWTFENHPRSAGQHIWVITDAYFLRKMYDTNRNVSHQWVKVIDRLAPAAMFVPYVEGGNRFKDIASYYTGIASLDQNAAPPVSLRSRAVLHENMVGSSRRAVVMEEVTDDFVRWMANGPGGYHGVAKVKRGEALVLWTMFSAYNYVYPTKYTFRDDGVIEVRMAASGANLSSEPIRANSHLHTAAWNMELNLCAWRSNNCGAEHVNIMKVSRKVDLSGSRPQEKIQMEPFNNNVEGGDVWVEEEFTALLITNQRQPKPEACCCEWASGVVQRTGRVCIAANT